jgi:hypothetical protein
MKTDVDESTATGAETAGSQGDTLASPVDDHTYNVLQALTSTLEAIEAYGKYQDGDSSGLFEQLREDEVRHAGQLMDELRACLATTRSSFMTSGPHRPVR